MEGGGGLLVGDRAKMDDLKHTRIPEESAGRASSTFTTGELDKGRFQSGNLDKREVRFLSRYRHEPSFSK